MLVFYSNDSSLLEMLRELEDGGVQAHLTDSQEEVFKWREEIPEGVQGLLFIDFDFNEKATKKFNASLVEDELFIRIIFSGKMIPKELKKHQRSKAAASAYLCKPLTAKAILGVLNDFQLANFISENELFEEGGEIPSLPDGAESVSEMKVDTQVRKILLRHSGGEGEKVYESPLNDKIQEKFDKVFGVLQREEKPYQKDLDISLTGIEIEEEENSLEGPSLDLQQEEEKTGSSPDGKDLDISFTEIEIETGEENSLEGPSFDLQQEEEKTGSSPDEKDLDISLTGIEIEEEENSLEGPSLDLQQNEEKTGSSPESEKERSDEISFLFEEEEEEKEKEEVSSAQGDSDFSLGDSSEDILSESGELALDLGADALEMELTKGQGVLSDLDATDLDATDLDATDLDATDELPREEETREEEFKEAESEVGEVTDPTIVMTEEMLLGEQEKEEDEPQEFPVPVPEIEGTDSFVLEEEESKGEAQACVQDIPSLDESLKEERERGDVTDPTIVMRPEILSELQEKKKDEPQEVSAPIPEIEITDNFILEEEESESEAQASLPDIPSSDESLKKEEEMTITPPEERIPPSFHEGAMLRLQATIRQLREEREKLLAEIKEGEAEVKVLQQDHLSFKAELEESQIEISILKKRHGDEIDEMKYRLRLGDEKRMMAEEKSKKLQKEFDRLQERVRIDFNHVKQREKDLESRLELVQMDSDSQVKTRDQKILGLKRKIDQLEFNMENATIREQKSRDDKLRLEEGLAKIMKTLRGSIELLESDLDFMPKIKNSLNRFK